MAYVISDECVACGTCAGECPVEAISEGDGKYVIDADTCVECGTCLHPSQLHYFFFLRFSCVAATIFLDC